MTKMFYVLALLNLLFAIAMAVTGNLPTALLNGAVFCLMFNSWQGRMK